MNLQWSYSLYIAYIFLPFCFLAVDTGTSYCAKSSHSYKISIIFIQSDVDIERFCSSVSIQSAVLRSPRSPSILWMYSLSVSLCGFHILFIVIIFRVFLSVTFSSSFAHFSTSALYLTKDTAQALIDLIVFPPFNLEDLTCLTLLSYTCLILSSIAVCIMS